MKSVLTIAGSDCSGGAGIQADLRTFASLGLHGTSVVTCVTAQNRSHFMASRDMPPAQVRAQLKAVWDDCPPAAVKTGMLHQADIILTVARWLKRHPSMGVVVDPVMVASSGRSLLTRPALAALTERLLPLATLVTPNIPEAEILADCSVQNPEGMRRAARLIQDRFGGDVLLKGGHLKGGQEAMDLLRIGSREWLLTSPRISGRRLHGTGCTYSAAIAGYLARGFSLAVSVRKAKAYMDRAIQGSRRLGKGWVLG